MFTYILLAAGSLILFGVGLFLLLKAPFYAKWKSGIMTGAGVVGALASVYFLFF